MPPLSFESAFSMRMPRVSAFLPDVTQHIHSLRASGVTSSHAASARGVEMRASFRSAGRGCTVPFEIGFAFTVMNLFYQMSDLYKKLSLPIGRDAMAARAILLVGILRESCL